MGRQFLARDVHGSQRWLQQPFRLRYKQEYLLNYSESSLVALLLLALYEEY